MKTLLVELASQQRDALAGQQEIKRHGVVFDFRFRRGAEGREFADRFEFGVLFRQ